MPFLFLTPFLIGSCAGAGAALGGIAWEAGRRFLTTTAEENFEPEYSDSFSKMLDLLMVTTVTNNIERNTTVASSDTASLLTASLVTEEESGTTPDEPPPIEATIDELADFNAEPEKTSVDPTASDLIELDVVVMREVGIDGRTVPVPVQNGEVLLDGIERDGEGDNLKIQFEVNIECYVYAVWVDATAWTTPLFPRSPAGSFQNPVQPNQRYSIPGGNDWWYLDDYRGVENLYFVASREPIPALEETLADFVGKERRFRSEIMEVALVDQPGELTRGLGGVRPGRYQLVEGSDGTSHRVESDGFLSTLGASELVVTRWFRHE